MADSAIQPEIQPDKNDSVAATDQLEAGEPLLEAGVQPPDTTTSESAPAAGLATVNWTPAFIVFFAVLVIVGLSVESIFTQGWASSVIDLKWILLIHVAVILGGWIAVLRATCSRWVRLGGIFMCIWLLFTSLNIISHFFQLDISSPIPAYLNATISSALLGAYTCLSLEFAHHTNPSRSSTWDNWFFKLAVIVGISCAALAFILTPAAKRSFVSLENDIAIIALALCTLVWWLRPSCWQTQPGITFLLGISSFITLYLSIFHVSSGDNSFLSQVTLLALILGTARILQGERVLNSSRSL
jgi:hypothetical protein